MSVIERGMYVAVGAFDLAAERVREIPVVEKVRSTSVFDQIREAAPKLRKRADELQTRGEKAVHKAQTRVGKVRTDARKQVSEFRTDARKQLETLQDRSRKALSQVPFVQAVPTTKKTTAAAKKPAAVS